jgi:DNA-binding phage protein
MASEFWDDLAEDLEDPDFLREYVVESVRIATIDSIMNTLLDALNATGMSKTGLAKVIHQQPAAIRRLFSSSHVNPTIGTLAEVAAALGLRITVEPLPDAERKQITEPLLEGRAADPQALAEHLGSLKAEKSRERVAANRAAKKSRQPGDEREALSV